MDMAKIALQLHTVREYSQKDMATTLQQIAALGYQAVELAGYGNLNAVQVRQCLDKYGLKAPSAHVALWFFENQLEQALEELQLLGCKYAVIPWLPEEWRTSKSRIAEFAELLNQFGQRCQQVGIQLAYHNHAFEFDPVEDSSVWQELTRQTDHSLVKFEFDIYWGSYAGLDPVEMLLDYPGRLPLLHIKDLAEVNGRYQDVPMGEGRIDWQAVFTAGRQTAVDWFIIEQDNPQDAFKDIATSLQNLKKLNG